MYLLYLLTISSYLLIYTFFDIEIMYLEILFFTVLMNPSAITDFLSLGAEYISVPYFLAIISLMY